MSEEAPVVHPYSLRTRKRHSSSSDLNSSPEAKTPKDVTNQAQKRLKALSPIWRLVDTLSTSCVPQRSRPHKRKKLKG